MMRALMAGMKRGPKLRRGSEFAEVMRHRPCLVPSFPRTILASAVLCVAASFLEGRYYAVQSSCITVLLCAGCSSLLVRPDELLIRLWPICCLRTSFLQWRSAHIPGGPCSVLTDASEQGKHGLQGMRPLLLHGNNLAPFLKHHCEALGHLMGVAKGYGMRPLQLYCTVSRSKALSPSCS